MRLPRTSKILNKDSLILDRVMGKTVLHIGCTDAPFTKQKLESGELLHLKVAKKVIGIDIQADSLAMMRNFGIPDLYNVSVYDLEFDKNLLDQKFDVILFPDVIEHLKDPGLALSKISSYIKKTDSDPLIILTAPNVNLYTLKLTDYLFNIETVHNDHYFYFSYKTLDHLIEDARFTIEKFTYATYDLRPLYRYFACIMNLISSSFMPCLYFEIRLKSNE